MGENDSPFLRPKKSLGQNFLRDPNTVRRIVGSLRAGTEAHVVEIGPGMGALTGDLLGRFAAFTAIEVDRRAVEYLKATHPTLDVRHQDVLETEWADLAAEKGGPLHVIGNLPYNITSQILFSLLSGRAHVYEAVVMMQLEVAERLVALPRTKAYGILSVQVQLHTVPELLFRVSPNVFYPRPDVTSAVVRLTFRQDGVVEAAEEETLRSVVRAAFNQRRKTLRNSLGELSDAWDTSVPERWAGKRAEELEPEEFVALARMLKKTGSEE
jgi:16S rRNA (adenine1518-N6/adenine1519-N6)-dimethyltransferase